METTFIYALNDPRTGLMRYIGKADNPQTRFYKHIFTLGTKDHRGTWLRSLLREGLKPELQILLEIPQEAWKRIERQFIKTYRSLGFDLVNGTEGGEGLVGYKASLETREKMRISHFGKKMSVKTLAKRSAAQRGLKRSVEFCEKMSALMRGNKSRLGKSHSNKTREKMRLAWIRRKKCSS